MRRHQRRFQKALRARRKHTGDASSNAILTLPAGLYPYQQQLIASSDDVEIVVSSTQIGKTTACACWLLGRAWVQPGTLNWWVAPTYLQTDIGFERMRSLARAAGVYLDHHLTKRRLWLTNGSLIEFRSWEREETLQGPTVHNMVIDEAGLLTATARAQLNARRSATLGPVRFIGNPGITGSEFWHVCQQALEREALGTGQGPRKWTWEDRAAALPQGERAAYTRFIQQERRDLDDSEFSRLYEAEWAVPERAIFAKHMDAMMVLDRDRNPHPGHAYIVAWDIGLEVDWTVGIPLCLDCFTITDLIRERPVHPNRVKSMIAEYSKHWNNATAVIETNGPGGPIFHEVSALYANVQKWWTDNSNKRVAVFEVLRRIKAGGLTSLKHKVMIEEFRVFQSKQNPATGLWSFAAPSRAHDDIVMAVLIAVGAATSGAAAMLQMMQRQLDDMKARKAAGKKPAKTERDVGAAVGST